MRGLKGGMSGVPGSELLSALLNPDGNKPKLDDCVAQVATIVIGDSSVMAVMLAPSSSFSPFWNGAWDQWSRMMVWRPAWMKPNGRAEATMLSAVIRELKYCGCAWEAIVSVCGEIFGDEVDGLLGLLSQEKETGEKVTRNKISRVITRPIEASEFEEIWALVPEEWRPVLERRANWEIPKWRDVENARMGPPRVAG
ncbi:hypothetical protein GNI_175900 [Gregarina niphandrodes]|uniref:Uncharacterized protein n=1 Tax=Gregarina niphandrodes TaxID=110365 RepID=A0A023AX97_GRENI|nr:hypothetical protein GNI_175900 [Gregarina niphandrodes]EZG43356.1 hypothetical protein GNI_175900 [Gregarina niphandrodes]|eukprot:XP_011134665.1 hypothetical protein GNI_175900 [Gregarina niphandrodes]